MSTIRHLHSLSAQLLLLKSTISPLHGLIQSLKYSDDAKAGSAMKADTGCALKHVGFVSREAKVYLADVDDHIAACVESLELFSGMYASLSPFQSRTSTDRSFSCHQS